MGRTTRRRHDPCGSQQSALLFADRVLWNLGMHVHRFARPALPVDVVNESLTEPETSLERAHSCQRPVAPWSGSRRRQALSEMRYGVASKLGALSEKRYAPWRPLTWPNLKSNSKKIKTASKKTFHAREARRAVAHSRSQYSVRPRSPFEWMFGWVP